MAVLSLIRLARTRAHPVVTVAAAVAFLAGCHSWGVPDDPSPASLRQESPRDVRVTRSSGEEILLRDARVREDSVVGTAPDGSRTAVALSSARRMQVREFDGVETALLTAGIGAGALVAVGALFTVAFLDALSDASDGAQQ